MASNNLIPTPITDKNGKQTTVYRSPETSGKQSSSGMPAPTMQAYVPPKTKPTPGPDESYEDRRARIKDSNERWRAGERPAPEELAASAMLAMDAMANIGWSIAQGRSESERMDIADSINSLCNNKDFAALTACDKFREVHHTLAHIDDYSGFDDEPFEISFTGEDTSDWEAENATSKNSVEVIDLIMTLRENDLMDQYEVPDHGDPRFFAHLYLSATGTLNYRRDDENTLAIIRLTDELPEKTEVIADGIKKNLHAEGIRALIDGELHSGIVSGAL